MASSREAFDKFWTWKNSSTVLKLTVLTNGGKPEILVGEIASIDEELSLVAFAITRERSFRVIDFSDASFSIGKRLLEAERPTGDRLMCEEVVT